MNKFIFFIILVAFPYLIVAQKDTIKKKVNFPPKSEGFYDIVYLKTETFGFVNNKNNISISFPYQIKEIDAILIKNDTFKTNPSIPFKNPPIFTGVAFEFNKNKNCVNVQFLLAINYFSSGSYGGSFSLGYGRAIDCLIQHKKFTVKPFLNVSEYHLDIPMGNIDNQNKYVYALGNTYDPTYTVTHHHKYGPTTTTIQNH